MYEHFYLKPPLPIGLFHPRLLLDGPPVITQSQPWKMSQSRVAPGISADHLTGDRYEDSGEQLIVHTMQKMTEKLCSLPAGQKEVFASSFVQGAAQLSKHQDNLIVSRAQIPAALPDLLLQSTTLFTKNRKRRLAGRELADQQEKDRIPSGKIAVRETEAALREVEESAQEMRDVHATAITRRDENLQGKSSKTAWELFSGSDSDDAPEGETNGIDGNIVIKVEPGFEFAEERCITKGDMMGDGDSNDYGSVIYDLAQFQTQDFHGMGIAGVDSDVTGDDDKTQSETMNLKALAMTAMTKHFLLTLLLEHPYKPFPQQHRRCSLQSVITSQH